MRHALLFLILFSLPLAAQDPADTTSWKHSVTTGVTLTQVSYTDWAQGGENAFAWTTTLDGKSTYEIEKIAVANNYKFAYGTTKLGTQGTRKTDDKIDLETMLTYKLGIHIDPYVAATLKTQFATGFKYATDGTAIGISDFWDPAFLTQSIGAAYQPVPEVKTRLGAGLREVLTSNYTQYSDDPSTLLEKETSKIDGGLESVTEVDAPIAENMVFKAKLELFAPFKTMDQVIVRSDNTIAAKINQYFSANLNVQFINERAITPRTQIKQTIALGFSYVLL